MIEKINHYFLHQDARGTIAGLVNFGTWEEVNLVTALSGVTRGGHYHKKTTELFIILDGEIDVVTRDMSTKTNIEHIEKVFSGDVFVIKPMTLHTFVVQKDARWINILSQKLDSSNEDFHRS